MGFWFVLEGTGFKVFELEMLEFPAFSGIFLQCIMVRLGTMYESLKILISDFLSSMRVL